MNRDLPPLARAPLLVLAMIGLAGGAAAGLVRMGWAAFMPSVSLGPNHGPLMICGFFGTVISLERAVAVGRRWGYCAPLCTGLGAFTLVSGIMGPAGAALLAAGSLGLLVMSLQIFRRQRALHTATLALGAAAWLAGNLAWAAGSLIPPVVPLWMAFLVLTIAGERLELSRFLPPSPRATQVFGLLVVALMGSALAHAVDWSAGARLFAATLLALAAWLMRQDIARRTIRERGLTRFIAACLLSGYLWLGAGALLLLAGGGIAPGSAAYDAGLHAVLLGFVFAMVFGHAPIIFPAVLGLRLPYHKLFYAPLAVLHLSLAIRIAGDLGNDAAWRASGGLLNAAALALFVLTMIGAAIRSAVTSR